MERNPHGRVGNQGNLRGMLEEFHCLGGLRWCLVAGRSGDILESSEIALMCRYFLAVGGFLILVSSQPASVKKRNWRGE